MYVLWGKQGPYFLKNLKPIRDFEHGKGNGYQGDQ